MISNEVIAKLKTRVAFEADADVEQFIADALNSYIELGQLLSQGGELHVSLPSGETRRVVLPFQRQST